MNRPEKKRKHDVHGPGELKLRAASNIAYVPIIATTPGIQIPENTNLTAYSRPRAPTSKRSKSENEVDYIVHGSTERIDYEGRELEGDRDLEKHYIGIYDPDTGEVEIHPAPRVEIRREIKALRAKDAELVKRNSAIDKYLHSRAVLGAEFGTKKSKKAIERRDLNKIDVQDMKAAVTTSIVSQIGENTESMLTREELDKAAEQRRLLPPHKTEGITSPAEVYNLDDVLSKEELELLWVQDWYKTAQNGEVVYVTYVDHYIPLRQGHPYTNISFYSDNTHVTNRIATLGLAKHASGPNTKKLKILRYISVLRNLYTFLSTRESERLLRYGIENEIRRHLHINGDFLCILLHKFTETVGGPTASQAGDEGKVDLRPHRRVSPAHRTKLLNYMAICCLFVEENFQVDLFYLKDDLGLQMREYAAPCFGH